MLLNNFCECCLSHTPDIVVVKKTRSALSNRENTLLSDSVGSKSVPSLKSTVRARQRAQFELKRQRSARARQAKMELARLNLAQTETRELEKLREQIKMPR